MRRRVESSAVTRPQIKSMAIPATNVEIDGIRGAVASMMLSCNLTRSMNWSRAFIRVETLGRLAFGALDLGLLQLRRNRSHHARRDPVLQIESIFQSALEAVRPDMRSRCRIYELTDDAYSICSFAHTAFEHVADPKLPTGLFHIHRPAFVREGRITRDHEQASETR